MKIVVQKFLLHTQTGGRSQQRHPRVCSSNTEAQKTETFVLACSAMSREHKELILSRRLCEDRKTVFEQFHPRSFFKSTIRVTMTQGAQLMSTYLNDQLKEDIERDELVARGQLTRDQADEQAEEWSEREWKKRIEELPSKLLVALAKYQAVILVMRLYEHLASNFVTNATLDKLTMDTFYGAKRSATQGKQSIQLGFEMLGTCWNANFISYLADYSVHQAILLFGYYVYVRDQRNKRKQQIKASLSDEDDDIMENGPLVLSMVRNSTLLVMSRGIGLSCAAVGGAIGSMFVPGWGTLIGTNLGDGFAVTLTEDLGSSPGV